MAVAEDRSEAIDLAQCCKAIHRARGDFEAIFMLGNEVLFRNGDDPPDEDILCSTAASPARQQERSGLARHVGKNEASQLLEVVFCDFESVPSHASLTAPDAG